MGQPSVPKPMSSRAVLATTGVDSQGCRFAKEALEHMRDQLGDAYVMPMLVEHLQTIPPMAKGVEPSVEPLEGGEWQLALVTKWFDRRRRLTLPDGTEGVEEWAAGDRRPFVPKATEIPERVTVWTDPVNFGSREEVRDFWLALEAESDVEFGPLARKAVVPDPQILFSLTVPILAYLIGKPLSRFAEKVAEKAGEKVGEELGEDLVKFLRVVKRAASLLTRNAIPRDSPIEYLIRAPGQPCLDLGIRTRDASVVEAAISEEALRGALTRALEMSDKLGADYVQYLWNQGASKWEFNYALTRDGKVIGTIYSIRRRTVQLHLLEQMVRLRDEAAASLPSETQARLIVEQLNAHNADS